MASISKPAADPAAKPAGSQTAHRTALAAELPAAAFRGDVKRVKQLLQAGVPVNSVCHQGHTALHRAAAAGHPDVEQELLANGADITATVDNMTPLLLALAMPALAQHSVNAAGQIAVAAVLLKAGAVNSEPVWSSGKCLANLIVAPGKSVMLQRLLAAGFNINQQSASGHTLLHIAAACGNEEAVATLLAHGAAVDVPDKDGITALTHAAAKQHTAVVQQLLAAGAAATAVSRSGETVLHYLSNRHYLSHPQCAAGPSASAPQVLQDILQLLVNSGADVSAKNPLGCTPLHFAAASGNIAAATSLLGYGSDVQAVNTGGLSCLSAAAGAGHADVVQLLLDAGAEAAASPLSLAVQG